MSQSSVERLRDYLGQLPPVAQSLLMREFERAIERGENVAVANFVLEELRKIVRAPSDDTRARTLDPMRLVFRPLDSFLVDGASVRPGQIRRSSLAPVWTWLCKEGCVDAVRAFATVLAGATVRSPEVVAASHTLQQAVAAAIADLNAHRGGRFGSASLAEDVASIGAVLKARSSLDHLGDKLPSKIRSFGDLEIDTAMDALNLPSLQNPKVLPFAVSLVMSRLDAPWQIVRLGIRMAGSDDEIRVAGTPFGVTVSMAIQELSCVASDLRSDIKRGYFENTSDQLKTLHDGVRGLRTELDIRPESTWGRQIAAIRAEIANALQSEITGIPGRVRRLLRVGPEKDINAAQSIDKVDVDETVGLIDFVAVCRSYAGELAINEASLRAHSELQQYVEKATTALIHALRNSDPRIRAYRRMQMEAAIRFCEAMFGADHAALMRKAAEHALHGEADKPDGRVSKAS